MRPRFDLQRSGNHSAFEHLVDHRPCDLIDECSARLWIGLEELNGALLLRRLRLSLLLPQLLAGRGLVLRDDLVRDHVEDPALANCKTGCKQSARRYEKTDSPVHVPLLIAIELEEIPG
jgi:hypothetical protein